MATWYILAARETGIQNLEQGWGVEGFKQNRGLDGKEGTGKVTAVERGSFVPGGLHPEL